MNNLQVVTAAPAVHIRFEGRSYEFPLADLDLGDQSSDEQIKASVARELGLDVARLRAYEIDRHADTGNRTVRPAAVFG